MRRPMEHSFLFEFEQLFGQSVGTTAVNVTGAATFSCKSGLLGETTRYSAPATPRFVSSRGTYASPSPTGQLDHRAVVEHEPQLLVAPASRSVFVSINLQLPFGPRAVQLGVEIRG